MSPLDYMPVLWVALPLLVAGILLVAASRRTRTTLISVVLFAGFVVAAATGIYAAGLFWRSGPESQEGPVIVVVEPGSTPALVAIKLEERGLLFHAEDLVRAARLSFVDRSFQAGRFHFDRSERILDILAHLTGGATAEELVTIPEGLRAFQVASILSSEAQVDSSAFITLIADTVFIATVIPPDGDQPPPESLDGYLLPETYNIYYRMPAADALGMIVSNFNDLWESGLEEAAEKFGMTRHEVVTLASIIEREAATDEERGLISAVFHNRLRRGMRLESCATVLYALGRFKKRLYERDLQVDSPYNTYLVRGFPPGPIANAGAASLTAAISPAETDFLYFVARGDGTHIFSRTFAEHIDAKRNQGSGVLVGGRAAREEAGTTGSPPPPGADGPPGD